MAADCHEHLQLVSSINFAKKKKKKNISLTYSQVFLLMHASFHEEKAPACLQALAIRNRRCVYTDVTRHTHLRLSPSAQCLCIIICE